MSNLIANSQNHGGILVPLDMFRPTMLAAVIAEALVGKATNIIGSKLVLTRHPANQLVLVTIEGHVTEDDPAAFWRREAELVLMASQVLPRQAFLYYVAETPEKRQGFIVAQRGQALAADDATADQLPAAAQDTDWPVAKLCQQMQLALSDLAGGFSPGPRVEIPLDEPTGDDQAMLMHLAGQPPEEDAGGEAAPAQPNTPAAQNPASPPGAAAAPSKPSVADDIKRRERERAEEEAELAARASDVAGALSVHVDELGVVVAPKAELGEPELLEPYIRAEIRGDLPDGIDRDMTDKVQGKRLDFAVRVDFLSEVFVDNNPLTRPQFEEGCQPLELPGGAAQAMAVHAPRLGRGTLIRRDGRNVFVSRPMSGPVAGELVDQLLQA